MTLSQPKRPEESIQRLIAALEPIAIETEVTSRKRLHWELKEKTQLYILKEGEISVLRASDGLLLASAYDSNVFGIGESFQPLRTHYLRAEKESTLFRVDANLGHEQIRKEELWEDVAEILSYYNSYLFYRNAMLVQQRTYSIIRDHLLELNQLPLESRLELTILEYIQERTHLSRSSILNVIFALKNGDYIEIKRGGYLLEVMSLPEKF